MQLNKKTFVIFPGRFHPWHNGHKSVYNYLTTKFGGNDVYITTTGVTELPKSPFTFDEKKQMMITTGIPANKILNVKNNYNLQSVANQIPINIERDSIIFAVSEKDMAEDPRFSKFTKKDGSPSYLQPIPKNLTKIQPAINHGYIDTVPTTDFTVLGKPARSASELRAQYVNLTSQQRKEFIKDLFGKYDPTVYNIMNNKLISPTPTAGLTEKQKKLLKKLIVGMMKEDESKVKNMKKLADMALYKQRQAELDDANEKLDSAEAQEDAAISDEDKKKADDVVKKAKDVVKKADMMSQAAKHQMQSS
jgi:nicotinic acid mononucleotide adenylyltransferase